MEREGMEIGVWRERGREGEGQEDRGWWRERSRERSREGERFSSDGLEGGEKV